MVINFLCSFIQLSSNMDMHKNICTCTASGGSSLLFTILANIIIHLKAS